MVYPTRPVDLGMNADRRSLGLGLRTLTSTAKVTHLNKNQANSSGLAANLTGNGRPIVLVFAEANNVLHTQTEGARYYVFRAFKLSDAAATNLAFEGSLSCKGGQPLFVVTV